jgi:Family of unknown function (DUF6161)
MKVRYHRYTHEQSFRSPKALADFAAKQAGKFSDLRETNANAFSWWAGTLANHWQGAVNAIESRPDDPNAAQSHFNEYPVFTFDSSLTKTLLEMTKYSRQQASQEIIPFLMGHREDRSSNNFAIGQLSAHSEFRMSLTLDRKISDLREYPIESLIAGHENRLASILEADEAKLQQQRSEFDSFIEEARSDSVAFSRSINEFLFNAKSNWEATHASFIEQLATETAVALWSKRSEVHKSRYVSFRRWVIGFGIGGVVAAIGWIFGGFALARWTFTDDKTAQLASYTAGSIVLFTLLVWGLRVLIRSMMSEDHLSTDASARSALAHTYLALIKEQAATENDRAIILAALFAPVSDGLVKDDGMPAFSPAALAAQAITNPR